MNTMTSYKVCGCGTLKVEGALWQYVRTDFFVLAAPKLKAPPKDPPWDSAVARAEVAVQLVGGADEAGAMLFTGTGAEVRTALRMLRTALGAIGPNDPMPLGFAGDASPSGSDAKPPPCTLDARVLALVASFVTDTEVVTVREHADRWVRIEAPRVRASVLPMEGDGPRLVLGASMPSNADDVHELNAGLLQDDRDYALAQARYLVGAIERLVGEPHVLRTLPLPGALTTLAHGADEGGAPEFAVSLRFVAEACQHHGLGWPDLDATRAQA